MPKIAIPTSGDELESFLTDSKKIQEVFNEGQFGELVKNYANVQMGAKTELAEEIREITKVELANFLKENAAVAGPNLPDLRPGTVPVHNGTQYNKNALGASVEGIWDGPAELFQALTGSQSGGNDAVRARSAKAEKVRGIQNSFGSVIPDAGGFLIPETLRNQLLQVALETAVVRPRATNIPMDSLRVPIPTIDSTSNATSIFGGVVAYWTEESAALQESQATFGRVVLDAKKLTAYAKVPNELAQDAVAFGAFFDQAFPQAISWYEDVAYMKGSGVGEPLGWIGAPATATVTAVGGQGTGTIVWENIVGMYARMLPASLSRAVWVADIATFPQLATMALSVGTGGSAIWLNNGAEGAPMTILGRPVIFTEKANQLGTAGDITFVDMSYYLIGDRMSMTAMTSEHYLFGNDQLAYRVIQRVDGRPWIQSAITPQNGGPALSPFVNLSSTRT